LFIDNPFTRTGQCELCGRKEVSIGFRVRVPIHMAALAMSPFGDLTAFAVDAANGTCNLSARNSELER
jgi:hypothetical protein